MNIGEQVLEMLKDEIDEFQYNRYIKLLKYDEENSTVSQIIFIASNKLIASYISRVYTQKIIHIFELLTEVRPNISIKVGEYSTKKIDNIEKIKVIPSKLNESNTFKNFVTGVSNEFAVKAAKNVSTNPGKLYNPLFIHGGVGLGKTHLMQAVGHVLLEKEKNIIFVSCEEYVNEFIYHIRQKSMPIFKKKYRQCDLLIIDDIQFISKKTETQEEFFNTFEHLRKNNKQIIMTSDTHPKKIPDITERLISRMVWGLVVHIDPPGLETKIEIINIKCKINKINIPTNVVHYIATILDNNVREIEGILIKLHAYSTLLNIKDIEISFVESILQEYLGEKKLEITLDNILALVAKNLNVKPSEICSKNRSRTIVYARRVAIHLSRNLTTVNMPKIASFYGMKDHSAISHVIRKTNELIDNDQDFKIKIDELTNLLQK